MGIGRKGMSPLIATVLLMAFAVALGGMIMNWSSDISESTIDCSVIRLDIIQFCHDDQAINIHVRNTGENTVEALALKIDNPATGQFSVALEDAQLRKGGSVIKKIPFLVNDDTAVSLIPSLLSGDKATECPEPFKTEKPLQKC